MKYILSVLISLTTLAKEKHQNHEAHVHGGATLAIAFDSNSGKVEFKAAADGILGFEHKHTSAGDKEKLQQATAIFESQINELIKFDPQLQCQFKGERVGLFFSEKGNGSGQHSDWIATYSIICQKAPQGSVVEIDFSKFPHIDDIDITALVGSVQKSAEYKKKLLKVELK